jgi:hypothetical protein
MSSVACATHLRTPHDRGYLFNRRVHGAEHKALRVHDGGIGTPGGLIRRLIEMTAVARRHCPSDSPWIYFCSGRLRSSIDHPKEMREVWTRTSASWSTASSDRIDSILDGITKPANLESLTQSSRI